MSSRYYSVFQRGNEPSRLTPYSLEDEAHGKRGAKEGRLQGCWGKGGCEQRQNTKLGADACPGT